MSKGTGTVDDSAWALRINMKKATILAVLVLFSGWANAQNAPMPVGATLDAAQGPAAGEHNEQLIGITTLEDRLTYRRFIQFDQYKPEKQAEYAASGDPLQRRLAKMFRQKRADWVLEATYKERLRYMPSTVTPTELADWQANGSPDLKQWIANELASQDTARRPMR